MLLFLRILSEVLGLSDGIVVDAVVCFALVVPVQGRFECLAASVSVRFVLCDDPCLEQSMLGPNLVVNNKLYRFGLLVLASFW
jgi:hypothetical protein